MQSLLNKYLKSTLPIINNTRLKTSSGYVGRVQANPENTAIAASFPKTNLDLESDKPDGGPINDRRSGFTHAFTSNKSYLDYIKKYK